MLAWGRPRLRLGTRTLSTASAPFIYADRAVAVLNKPPAWISQLDKRPDAAAPFDINRRPAERPSQFDRRSERSEQFGRGLERPARADSGAERAQGSGQLHDEMPMKDALRRFREEHNLAKLWVCHRLDKVTTGAMLVATSEASAAQVHGQFAARTVDKVYLALVRAGRDAFASARGGEIHDAVHRSQDGTMALAKARKGSADGVYSASTRWEVLDSSPIAPVSLVKFMPATGRKHQIRLHASYALNCPILGEKLYTASRPAADVRQALGPLLHSGRLFLHASSLSLFRYRQEGPKKRFRLGVTAPLPDDFAEACAKLKIFVPKEFLSGGVYVDGERVKDGVVEGVEGRWLL